MEIKITRDMEFLPGDKIACHMHGSGCVFTVIEDKGNTVLVNNETRDWEHTRPKVLFEKKGAVLIREEEK